jgi:hypothetical protein
MRNGRPTLAVSIVILLVLTLATAFAQTTETLTGCLEKADDGSFALAQKGKTEKVKLHAPSDLGLGAHVGHTVRVTGEWRQGDDGGKAFHVSKMEHVEASCS